MYMSLFLCFFSRILNLTHCRDYNVTYSSWVVSSENAKAAAVFPSVGNIIYGILHNSSLGWCERWDFLYARGFIISCITHKHDVLWTLDKWGFISLERVKQVSQTKPDNHHNSPKTWSRSKHPNANFNKVSTTHLELRQAHRRHLIREHCSANSSFNFPGKFKTFDQIPSKALDHLIVDDHRGVIYCFVPKVACTNWKRVMIVLSQSLKAPDGAPYLDPLDIPSALSHNATLHLTFNKFWRLFGRFSRALMHHKLKNYTKFLFVRDPFVRLISAFRNKFALPNEDFYRQFGSVMLHRYANISKPPDSAQEAFAAGPQIVLYSLY